MALRHGRSRSILALVLGASFGAAAGIGAQSIPGAQIGPAQAGCAVASYDEFLRTQQSTLGTLGPGQEPVELLIMGAPDAPPAVMPAANCERGDPLVAGVEVSVKGSIAAFLNGNGAFRGSGSGRLPPDIFAEIEQLLGKLPDDGHRLPPAGHSWVTVDVLRDGVRIARVYDQSDLPDEVIEMIRLTGARIPVFTPVFQHTMRWPSLEQFIADGAPAQHPEVPHPGGHELAFSPGGNLIARWETSDYVDCCPRSLTSRFSITPAAGGDPVFVITDVSHPQPPSGGTLDIQATRALFSPDGRTFLLVTNRPEVRLYDTAHWQLIGDLLPPDAIDYIPSPDWKTGVAFSGAGGTVLWDVANRTVLKKLDLAGKLLTAVFSPDGKVVAITSHSDGHPVQLTLWDASDGHRIRELYPVDWQSSVQGTPQWWDGGKYIFAGFGSAFGSPGVGIWEVSTGRFRGSLATCFNSFSTEPFDPQLGGLHQYCSSGEVWGWNPDEILQQLEKQ